MSGSNLYVGGEFTTAGGVQATNIALWNGKTWSALGSGVGVSGGGYVSALACDNAGKVYAGGNFTAAGAVLATNIAVWDGSTWSALGSGIDGQVLALAVSGGTLYAGGNGGTNAQFISAWDGSQWSALGSGVDGQVLALLADGADHLFVGGEFSLAGTNVSPFVCQVNLGVELTVAVSASPSAGGTVSGGGVFSSGNSVTVTASPNNGYTFANWTENASVVSSTARYTFTLSTNVNLTANFVTNAPVISREPVALTRLQGQPAGFVVTAAGPGLNYQWCGPLGAIAGATARGYTNPAANLDDAGNYWVVVSNNAGSVTSTVARLTVNVDTTKPTVTITSPKNLFETDVNVINVHGTATTAGGRVSAVQVSVNGGAFAANLANASPASATWGMTVTNLVPGTNVVAVYATSFAGTNSATVIARYFFRVPQILTLYTNGVGTLQGATGLPQTPRNGASLYVGRDYTITATPGTGFVFSNWVGTVSGTVVLVSDSPKLTFTMQSDLVLRANFLPNPFSPAQGTYNGLFGAAIPDQGSSGFVTLTLSDRGTYSGSLKCGATSYPFTGQFDLGGAARQLVSRPKATAWALAMQLDIGAQQVRGGVSNAVRGGWAADLLANRAGFDARTHPATQYAGKSTGVPSGRDERSRGSLAGRRLSDAQRGRGRQGDLEWVAGRRHGDRACVCACFRARDHPLVCGVVWRARLPMELAGV